MTTPQLRFAPGSTSVVTNVAGSATSVTLKVANAARVSLTIFNDSNVRLLLKYGATASVTSNTKKLEAGQQIKIVDWAGRVDGIWTSASGFARVTEVTP